MMHHDPSLLLDGFFTPRVVVDDPAFAVDSEAHPPTCSCAWASPSHLDTWVRAHDSIRAEVADLKHALDALDADELAPWQAESLLVWWRGHEAHVTNHHQLERGVLFPLLRERINLPGKFERDHAALASQALWLRAAFELVSTASACCCGPSTVRLRELWPAWECALLLHMHEKETAGLPLMRAFFRPDEARPATRALLLRAEPLAQGSILHSLGSRALIEAHLRQEGITKPALRWHLALRRRRKLYRARSLTYWLRRSGAGVWALGAGHVTAVPPAARGGGLFLPGTFQVPSWKAAGSFFQVPLAHALRH